MLEMPFMEIQIGCNFGEFKQYYEALWGKLGETEEYWIKQNPSHLIVLKEKNEIIGDAIWHESTTREHKPGDSREIEDQRILLELLGSHCAFVELHEVWIRKEYRGKGYGKKLFSFFEEFMRNNKYTTIIYYAYNPAALAICRKRGYREQSGLRMKGIEGNIESMYVLCKAL